MGDPHAGYTAGNLKFHLNGHKLHGGFALIKLKGGPGRAGRGDERSWLLIKERDATARPESELSITADRPESVTTQRGLDDVAADRSRVWHSNRGQIDAAGVAGAVKGPLPKAFKPALARVAQDVPDGDRWLHERGVEGERPLGGVAGQTGRPPAGDGGAGSPPRAK